MDEQNAANQNQQTDTPAQEQQTVNQGTENDGGNPSPTPQAEPQAQQDGAGEEPEVFEVKHNKETVRLTRDQLLEAASKGLDYDRVRQPYDFLKQQAQTAGFDDVGKYVDTLKMQMGQLDHSKRVEQYVNAGYLPEQAEHQAKTDEAISSMQARFKAQEEKEHRDAEISGVKQEFKDLLPGGKLPDLVKSALKGREENVTAAELRSMLSVYKVSKAVIDGFKAKDRASKANAAGAAASPGPVNGASSEDKEFYTSKEFDELPKARQKEIIKSGKFWKMAQKWKK